MIDCPANPSEAEVEWIRSLSHELNCQVTIGGDFASSALVEAAKSNSGIPQVDQYLGHVVLCLPSKVIIGWQAPREHVDASVAHAKTLLRLRNVEDENEQLNAEVESLVCQVSQNFEELSVIGMLATSNALPSEDVSTGGVAIQFLEPLQEAIGAESVGGMLLAADGSVSDIVWSGEAMIPDENLKALIEKFCNEAESHPVVKNDICDPAIANVSELVLVQSRCEGRLHGWFIAVNRIIQEESDRSWTQLGFTTVQANMMETVVNQLGAQLHNLGLLEQKENLLLDMVRALVNALDARDPYTCGHSERVALFARFLASKAGLSPDACRQIYLTGLLHDVGKIAIPDKVLLKPSKLTDDERTVIQTHTDAGWRILHELEALRDVLKGVLYHHENFNGTGYPDGLAGQNIPIDGRILAVCDAFDAMTSDRPYRTGMSVAKATEILRGGAGTYWDPHLVSVFLENMDTVEKIRCDHQLRKPSQRQKNGTLPALAPLESVASPQPVV